MSWEYFSEALNAFVIILPALTHNRDILTNTTAEQRTRIKTERGEDDGTFMECNNARGLCVAVEDIEATTSSPGGSPKCRL